MPTRYVLNCLPIMTKILSPREKIFLDICPQENEGEGDSADPWTGSDRDYLYDELLQVNLHVISEICSAQMIYPDVGCKTISKQKLMPLLSESVWNNEGQEPRHGCRREKEVCDETTTGEKQP